MDGNDVNASRGRAVLGQIKVDGYTPTTLTTTNFIGTTTAAYTDTQTATVTLPAGVSTNQSGLTPSSVYYIQEDGTLATTPDDPSVEIGRALSSTSLLLKAY